MNIILFRTELEAKALTPEDPRTEHIRKVLKMGTGDSLFIGILNGPMGKATIEETVEGGMQFSTVWETRVPAAFPLKLLVGLPRPQTARKILQECSTLGVSEIGFFQAEKGEPSYAESKLWSTAEWSRLLVKGAEQAFHTSVPNVRHYPSLEAALSECVDANIDRLALDVYEGEGTLATQALDPKHAVTLAIGAERGWSSDERILLRAHNYRLCDLGPRVLRTETACTFAIAQVLSKKTWTS